MIPRVAVCQGWLCGLLFFPASEIDHILTCTNEALTRKKSKISKDELLKTVGYLYVMTTMRLPQRRDYFSSADFGPIPALQFGTRFGTGKDRSETILRYPHFEKKQ